MGLILKTAPLSAPVTLDEAKAHLNVLSDLDDELISFLIGVATEQAEEITNRQLMRSTYEMTMDILPDRFEIKKPPLHAVEKIEYIPDGSDSYAILDPSKYMVDNTVEPGVVIRRNDATYPAISWMVNAVRVTFTAGYADAASVPKSIKQWMLIRIATLFEHREEIVVGVSVTPIQNNYNDYLISKYRVISL
ncbi:MAG: head-tail connector protein [Sulfuricurvum sp.]|uniref:head-tail connector protein n=1 Tax=Sulfuricurvum sp. TaxID=2025608 RepID=UPI00262F1B2B|nr:head-tail connector protein [Sulfuricurvum sp.]MDD5159684.1 head-tail connector protein [Sulfuricurvum sp.]